MRSLLEWSTRRPHRHYATPSVLVCRQFSGRTTWAHENWRSGYPRLACAVLVHWLE